MSKTARTRIVIHAVIALVATAAGWLAVSSSLGEQLELRTYDYRFRVKEIFPQTSSAPITILAVDEQSLASIPDPTMLWHRHYAEVLNALVDADAAVVALDVIFASIERFDADGQRSLSQALLRAGKAGVPVILSYRVRGQGTEQPPAALVMAADEAFDGKGFAYVNLSTDPDDFIRRQLIRQTGDGNTANPGLAYASATAFAERKGQPLQFRSDDDTVLINYLPRGSFPHVSFADALEAAKSGKRDFFREKFAGRIVLIARLSERGGEDLHSTPLYYSAASASPQGLRTPGAEIHANVIATIVDNRPMVELPGVYQLLVAAVTAFVFTFAWGYFGLRRAFVLSLVAIAVLAAFVIAAFLRGNHVWIVSPLSSAGAALVLTLGSNYFLEGREKRRLRSLFSRYVSDAVILHLMERPAGVVLHGERRRIAVLFADIKGFTTISETTSPERVVQLLNEYFGVVVEVIQSHGGTVNSLMGDGIMAIFGAPVADEDAALHAVQAAQEMMRALGRVNHSLKTLGFNPIAIGIGINSGDAVIGNMGSPRKMEYTAIGDVVNTAARIEGQTRSIAGADILISKDTSDWLKGRVSGVEFAKTAGLKGKDTTVDLYRVPWN